MSKFESPEFLIEKYKKAYFQNPGSRFFAPLAEAYRKAGSYDEAIDLLKRGIKDHPHYASAYVCLAQCYLDLNQLNIAFSLLSPLTSDHSENYKLMSLFAEVAERLGYTDKALETYKTLLFLHPKDSRVIEKVKSLESALNTPAVVPESATLFNLNNLDEASWQEVTLQNIDELEVNEKVSEELPVEEKREVKINFEEERDEPTEEPRSYETQPVITHTLVDLYLNQGHKEKALEIIDKILEANPKDQRTIDKKQQILELLRQEPINTPDTSQSLMDVYDQKIGDVELSKSNVRVEKLEKFLTRIKDRATYKNQIHAK